MNKLYPDYYFDSVFELSAEFFLSKGISHVIFDIDDTLVPHGTPSATPEICAFLASLEEVGLTVALISNSKTERAAAFNASLPRKLFAIGKAGKPKKSALNPFFENFSVSNKKVALVGDQLLTDICLGNRLGLTTVLVRPILPFENPFFYLKRAIEKPILRRYFKMLEQQNQEKEQDYDRD